MNDNIIKPAVEPMSDEQIEKIQNSSDVVEKKSHTGLIIGIVVGFLFLGGCLFGVALIIGGINRMGREIEQISRDDDYYYPDEVDDGEEETPTGKYIGNSKYGYLNVTDYWTTYHDDNTGSTLQYRSGLYVITMYAVPTSQLSAYDYADRIYDKLEEDEASSLTSAKVMMGSYMAYRVSGYYSEVNTWLSTWTFETDDGMTRYISVEGPDKENNKFLIPNTFSLEIKTSYSDKMYNSI